MTGGELALLHQLAHGGGEGEEAQGVGHGAAGLAHPLRGLLLGEAVAVHQGLEAGGLLHGVQVLPLEVLHHRELRRLAVVSLDDQHRDLREARQPGGPPAALARDDLIVAALQAADGEGLQDAVLPDGLRQLLQRLGIEGLAGLGGTVLHLRDGHRQDAAAVILQRLVPQKGAQAPAQAGGFFRCHEKGSFLRACPVFPGLSPDSSAGIPGQRRRRPPRPGSSGRRRRWACRGWAPRRAARSGG